MINLLSKRYEDFYIFRNEIQHMLRKNTLFTIKTFLDNNLVVLLYEKGDYIKSLYILSCIDTVCKQYNLPLNSEYDEYRQKRISPDFYLENEPTGKPYLEEFVKHGIYEVSLYDCF